MARIISFGWTWPALLAPSDVRKTCTRRSWKPSYARRFSGGNVYQAWTKSPRFGGKRVGMIRLEMDPAYLPLAEMSPADYVAEGFAFLHRHPELVPASMPIDVSPQGFSDWRDSGGSMWLVAFELVSVSYPVAGAPQVEYSEALRAELLEKVLNGTYNWS